MKVPRRPQPIQIQPGCRLQSAATFDGVHCLRHLLQLALLTIALISFPVLTTASGSSADTLFREAAEFYQGGDFERAATLFRKAASSQPASGTLQNLGLAEWRTGHAGAAVLAWEQALWVDPFNAAARGNLRYARKVSQLEAPELAWYEVVCTWLPANCWVWIAGLSFWFAVGIGALPGMLRMRKAAWQQALAAFGLAVFLLSLPAHFGVETRSRIGFILEKNTPLRLTGTEEAQYLTRLPAGEPARLQRVRGKFVLIRTNHVRGWVERTQFGLISPPQWTSGRSARPE